ncbi:hypothetical protein AN220_27845, partial [Streptomyces nanshensis]
SMLILHMQGIGVIRAEHPHTVTHQIDIQIPRRRRITRLSRKERMPIPRKQSIRMVSPQHPYAIPHQIDI